MAVKIQIRRDTSANWSSNNPTLSEGEIGFATDLYKIKIGDGATAWNSLSYFSDLSSVIDGAPEALDTLNELAAAIGDDPDFLSGLLTNASASSTYLTQSDASSTYLSQSSASSTYLTQSNASSTYAPISSPTFTGTVTVPTLELTNALAISEGGTGQTTANAALNALVPSQSGNSGKYLTTDGTNTSWATVEAGGGGTASDDTIFKAQLFFGGSN